MTLRDLIRAHPSLFYQPVPGAWFADEPFMDTEPSHTEPLTPPVAVMSGVTPDWPTWAQLPSAAALATIYAANPSCPHFAGWLWTRDVDRQGQRVYVGGTRFGNGFQIHRHLHLTDDWGVALWGTH